MQHRLVGCALLAATVFASCTGEDAATSRPPAASPAAPSTQRYHAGATVLESKRHGPMLCLGVMAPMLPPACGDVPISNWRWRDVRGEESMAGTTWGAYHVVGTFDGRTFTLTERPRPPGPAVPESFSLASACPTPEGGWRDSDPARAFERDLAAATAVARQSPDLAGLWIENGGRADQVLNVAFTGDLERHEADLRARWGGPLCVSKHAHALRDLRRIQGELTAGVPGIRPLTVGVDEVRNQVLLLAVLIDDQARRALAERFGDGVVRATSALRPIP